MARWSIGSKTTTPLTKPGRLQIIVPREDRGQRMVTDPAGYVAEARARDRRELRDDPTLRSR